jgi:hypothetical protein
MTLDIFSFIEFKSRFDFFWLEGVRELPFQYVFVNIFFPHWEWWKSLFKITGMSRTALTISFFSTFCSCLLFLLSFFLFYTCEHFLVLGTTIPFCKNIIDLKTFLYVCLSFFFHIDMSSKNITTNQQ